MHLTRAGTTWQWEVRWDGVGSRAAALEKLRARAKAVAPGEWIYNLGGWAIEQFADDPRPFTREELDKVVPNNPVFLQASYYEAYLNSRALQAMGIDDKTPERFGRARQRRPPDRPDHRSRLPRARRRSSRRRRPQQSKPARSA